MSHLPANVDPLQNYCRLKKSSSLTPFLSRLCENDFVLHPVTLLWAQNSVFIEEGVKTSFTPGGSFIHLIRKAWIVRMVQTLFSTLMTWSRSYRGSVPMVPDGGLSIPDVDICSSVRSEGNNRWCRRMSAKACARRQDTSFRGKGEEEDSCCQTTHNPRLPLLRFLMSSTQFISFQTKNNYWLIFSIFIKEGIMSVLVIFGLCQRIKYYGHRVSRMMSEIIVLLGLNPRIKNQWLSISTFMSKDENKVVCYISAFVKGWNI